jgi:hypothetical protein
MDEVCVQGHHGPDQLPVLLSQYVMCFQSYPVLMWLLNLHQLPPSEASQIVRFSLQVLNIINK